MRWTPRGASLIRPASSCARRGPDPSRQIRTVASHACHVPVMQVKHVVASLRA